MSAPEDPILSPTPIGPIIPPVPATLEGMAAVGAALLQLGEALRAAMPLLAPAVDELQNTVEAALPVSLDLDDGFGNGWRRCAPACDLEIVRPGKVQCSGIVCGEAKQ